MFSLYWCSGIRRQHFTSSQCFHTMFFFPSFSVLSLANAKVFEDYVQDLLRSDPTSDPTQAGQRQPDALGCQGQVHVTVPLVLRQGRHTVLQMGPVSGLGQRGGARQRVATPTEEARAQNEPDRSLLSFAQRVCLSDDGHQRAKKQKTKTFCKISNQNKCSERKQSDVVLSPWTSGWQLTVSWRCCAAQSESPAVLGWCDRRGDKREGVRTHVSAPRPAAAAAPRAAGPFYSAPAEPCLKERHWSVTRPMSASLWKLFFFDGMEKIKKMGFTFSACQKAVYISDICLVLKSI